MTKHIFSNGNGRRKFNKLNSEKQIIEHTIFEGDSLGDRGAWLSKKIAGISLLPYMKLDKSPRGRFTNGFGTIDALGAILASEFYIRQRQDVSSCDISDNIITKKHQVSEHAKNYSLLDSLYIDYQYQNFMRTYAEGGLTSKNYKKNMSFNLSLLMTRMVVSNLQEKTNALLAYDSVHGVNEEYKKHTLIVEWSGANDLITVNRIKNNNRIYDNVMNAYHAVLARIENIKKLIDHGYRNFYLLNLPNLSLTPRFQKGPALVRKKARLITNYFNNLLFTECKKLLQYYNQEGRHDINIDIFDMNKLISETYYNKNELLKYGLDHKKILDPFINSKEFKINKEHTSHGFGHMFWDDLHPTMIVEFLIASSFYDECSKKYDFQLSDFEKTHSTTSFFHDASKMCKKPGCLNKNGSIRDKMHLALVLGIFATKGNFIKIRRRNNKTIMFEELKNNSPY